MFIDLVKHSNARTMGEFYQRGLNTPNLEDVDPEYATSGSRLRSTLVGAALGATPGAALALIRPRNLISRTSILTRPMLALGAAAGALSGYSMSSGKEKSQRRGTELAYMMRNNPEMGDGDVQLRAAASAGATKTLGALGVLTGAALGARSKGLTGRVVGPLMGGVVGGVSGTALGLDRFQRGRESAAGMHLPHLREDFSKLKREKARQEAAAARNARGDYRAALVSRIQRPESG